MPTARKVKAKGGDMLDDLQAMARFAKVEPVKADNAKGGDFMDFFPVLKVMGAGLKKTARGRK